MMKRSKRYQALSKKIDKTKSYPLSEAIKLVKETGTTKFVSSIEVHIKTGIDANKTEQQIRGSVSLPNGTGKTIRIAAFVPDSKEKEAKEAGADLVGGEALVESIKKTGKIDFDVAVTTPDMMPKLAVIAKILGPRGLMPSPKNGTITPNLKKTIDELKKGKVNFKNDSTGNLHLAIGKTSFDDQKITENIESFLAALKKAKPSSAKGNFIKSVTLASSMGPGVKVQL
ncbi:MAG: 50S ribosomal protein L1 [Candidatus Buchananbacteria bacterium]|nr:50S ribosomal protein L1 [Candidatus Buchananbacteria bacterium]